MSIYGDAEDTMQVGLNVTSEHEKLELQKQLIEIFL